MLKKLARFAARFAEQPAQPPLPTDLVGTTLGGYRVVSKIGEGGMGQVYLAQHERMGRRAALKVMHPVMMRDPDASNRFKREAENASQINHPNVAAVYDFDTTPAGITYLAMEFIDGPTLTNLIDKLGAIELPRTADIVEQTAEALAAAHDLKIVHRDLKPDNIMVARRRDGGDFVKVVDFGIAKAADGSLQKVTRTGLVVGTPEYMSPEQLAGDSLDGRSDVYSLGLVAFRLLTGELAFASNSLQELMRKRFAEKPRTLTAANPDVAWTSDIQAVMDRALELEISRRFQTPPDFAAALSKAIVAMQQADTVLIDRVLIEPPAPSEPAGDFTRVFGRADSGATPTAANAAKEPAAAPDMSIFESPTAAPVNASPSPVIAGVFAPPMANPLAMSGLFAEPAAPLRGAAAVPPALPAATSAATTAAAPAAQQPAAGGRRRIPLVAFVLPSIALLSGIYLLFTRQLAPTAVARSDSARVAPPAPAVEQAPVAPLPVTAAPVAATPVASGQKQEKTVAVAARPAPAIISPTTTRSDAARNQRTVPATTVANQTRVADSIALAAQQQRADSEAAARVAQTRRDDSIRAVRTAEAARAVRASAPISAPASAVVTAGAPSTPSAPPSAPPDAALQGEMQTALAVFRTLKASSIDGELLVTPRSKGFREDFIGYVTDIDRQARIGDPVASGAIEITGDDAHQDFTIPISYKNNFGARGNANASVRVFAHRSGTSWQAGKVELLKKFP